MADIIAVISDPYGAEPEAGFTVVTSSTAIPSNTIENLADVDLQALTDGSVLVYKTTTNKWTATTVLDAQDITGGHY
jgi:hypothetical protein